MYMLKITKETKSFDNIIKIIRDFSRLRPYFAFQNSFGIP